MGEGAEQTLKIVGGFLLVVVFTLAYVLGQNAQTKTQKNMQSRLELTRQRFQNCDTERRMLGGSMKGKEQDELKIAEQDHQALVSENQLLNEDNQQLRQDNYALEEQIDELRDELDDKDFVSDDEVEQLEEAMSFGNNSAELKEFLDDAQILGGINKDTLITKLMAELKVKRGTLRKCRAEKGAAVAAAASQLVRPPSPGTSPTPPPEDAFWKNLDKEDREVFLSKAVTRIATAQLSNITEALALYKKWVPRYPGGMDELQAAVAKATRKLAEAEAAQKAPTAPSSPAAPAAPAAPPAPVVAPPPAPAAAPAEEPVKPARKVIRRVVEEEEPEKPAAAPQRKKVVVEAEEPAVEEVVVRKRKRPVRVVEEEEEPVAEAPRRKRKVVVEEEAEEAPQAVVRKTVRAQP